MFRLSENIYANVMMVVPSMPECLGTLPDLLIRTYSLTADVRKALFGTTTNARAGSFS